MKHALKLLSVVLFASFATGSFAQEPEPATTANSAKMSASVASDDEGRILIEARGIRPRAPLFFSARAENKVQVGTDEVAGTITLRIHVIQGRPEVLTLGLDGDGEVVEVTGEGLKDWAVRKAGGKRFLDLRPLVEPEGKPVPGEFTWTVRTRIEKPQIPGRIAIPLAAPGDAVGFASRVTVTPAAAVDFRVVKAEGMIPLGDEAGKPHSPQSFYTTQSGAIEVMLARRGAVAAEATMIAPRIFGKVDTEGESVAFRLLGAVEVRTADTRLRLLSGRAALTAAAGGENWNVELIREGEQYAYDIVFSEPGTYFVDVPFVAAVRERGDWRTLDFRVPAGAVVPMAIEGLGEGVTFDSDSPVVPQETKSGWTGFLPADGNAVLAWKRAREKGEGTLFFSSHETSEVRVGAGLLRQDSKIDFRILQGKLTGVKLALDGPGEILGVEGGNVLGWKVVAEGDTRVLDVRLSRPFEGEGSLTVRSQSALGSFPVRAEALRLTPEGTVRHSGYIRVTNSDAVRLEVAEVEGMMQLAPDQFPGGALKGAARQTFVYRFPSATYSFHIMADQILPEVGVSQIVLYELAETDRVITAELELDIREAPLREWSLAIPDGYAVVSVTGSDVADYVAESALRDGKRPLKILFGKAVSGRQLVQLRLERNEPAATGDWQLPPIVFPGAKSVRGHIGVVAVPGYRIAPQTVAELVEVPVSYFPKQTKGLQAAYRLREPDWSALMKIEAIGQSVQADVFHLYSLKEGVAYGSVLINYFVVGAPANEWRIEVPESVGNIDVVGQDVRRDWRREGNEIIVSLHQPVLGSATLLITFEQPMSARGGALRPGVVRPLNVQSERGYIQVVSPLQVKYNIAKATSGLLKLEPLELPAEYRLLTSSPSLAVYQYTTRPFELEMNVEWFTPAEMVGQVVDFAKLSSQISRDGQIVTDARFFVKSRGRQALRMTLPESMKLWEARVDGEVVNARADGSQTLVPLPPRIDPNQPVEVALMLGQVSKKAKRIELAAPTMTTPTVISEWTLESDPERQLVPKGGTADLTRPVLTETGFAWMANRGRGMVIGLLVLVGLGALLARGGAAGGWKQTLGILVGAFAVCAALAMAVFALEVRQVNRGVLEYAAPVIPAGETVTIKVANVAGWSAMLSGWGVFVGIVGAALLAAALLRMLAKQRVGLLAGAGAAFLGAGILWQRGGAVVFFLAVAVAVFALFVVPEMRAWFGAARARRRANSATAAAAATAMLAILVACPVAALAKEEPDAVPWLQTGTRAAESIVQTWKIREGRLYAELELTVRGEVGDSFLLMTPPAILTGFEGEGLNVTKVAPEGGVPAYYIIPEVAGTLTARATFEMSVKDQARGIPVPTGPAAVQRIAVELDEGGWEFTSPSAVRVVQQTGLGADRSGATLVLGPGASPKIALRPKRRDIAAEATQYFVEVANLYMPGPGVVNGRHRVTVRPAQGQVSSLELDVPEGYTVGEVGNGPVGTWRFDPTKRKLYVAIEPAQQGNFQFDVETQLGTEALPVKLALAPLRVAGAAGEVGMLALAFGGDAQPENLRPEGLSPVNPEDFDAGLIPESKDKRPVAVVQQVYRYGKEGGTLALTVAPVAPEVRLTTKQVLSMGDDRLVMAVDLNVAITRAGLFKLSFALPAGLEVESLSGPSLSHWTEAGDDETRIVTMHLKGRTIGPQTFALTLAGPAPAAQEAWSVPRFLLREATRQTGELLLVPEKGIRLRAVDRSNVSQLDPRAAGGTRPGTLAFRLLQEDWSLKIGIEALDPWVTAQSLQEIQIREGQTLTRISLHYRIDNAAVKQLRVRLPGLSEAQARTVRASGSAVSDLVHVSDDLWEIRFQRGVAGETDVEIEYQGQTAPEQGKETFQAPVLEEVRQATQFVAVRGSGRLEVDTGNVPRGWQAVDWSAVPTALQDQGDRSVPALCFRVAEPEGPLVVDVQRHAVADALKLRVTKGELATVFSPAGPFITSVKLDVKVVEKGSIRVRLPEGASLFNTFVNDESVPVVREGDAYLFHVSPNTDEQRPATVRLAYAVPVGSSRGKINLAGPQFSVPLENVSWRVVVPAGYELDDYDGGFRLQEEKAVGRFGVKEYQSEISSKRASEAKEAERLLERANTLLQQGEQKKASEVLSQASKSTSLDEASNEDARVQLRALKEQQAVLGLNTRRQRLYFDNGGATNDTLRNEQLEQAAQFNPFMQNDTNFNPQQVDQLLQGNTAEENAALRGIATRLVDQQLAAEPAPSAIDITLPERGKVLTFTRSLQVDGAEPLSLRFDLDRVQRSGFGFGLLLLAAVAVVTALVFPRGQEK